MRTTDTQRRMKVLPVVLLWLLKAIATPAFGLSHGRPRQQRCTGVVSRSKPAFSYRQPLVLHSTRPGSPLPPDQNASSEEEEEENAVDLFDYFDPLLSPHAYPNGISPDQGLPNKNILKDDQMDKDVQAVPPRIEDTPGRRKWLTQNEEIENPNPPQPLGATDDEPDLFDYFDPLLSPHAYPDGIQPRSPPIELQQSSASSKEGVRESPLRLTKGLSSNSKQDETSASPRSRSGKIGILLVDHGSRNPKSNSRLHDLAKLYQMTLTGEGGGEADSFVVTGAHMEIATPSIPDGLKTLMDQGVDSIVCHPYFLSPGRHVTQDIPQILDDAIQSMEITIPVVTTDPVGSNTSLMIGAIHSLVRETAAVVLRPSTVNTQSFEKLE